MEVTVYRFIVHGRVQGVWFRQSTLERAQALGLDGWVMNRTDGSVEGLAAGSVAALDQLRSWLADGPPAARVDSVEWMPETEVPAPGFVIRRGAA